MVSKISSHSSQLLGAIVMQEKTQANIETAPGTDGQGKIFPLLLEYKQGCTLLSVAFYIVLFFIKLPNPRLSWLSDCRSWQCKQRKFHPRCRLCHTNFTLPRFSISVLWRHQEAYATRLANPRIFRSTSATRTFPAPFHRMSQSAFIGCFRNR